MNEKGRRLIITEKPLECVNWKRINTFVLGVLLDGRPKKAYLNNTGRLSGYSARKPKVEEASALRLKVTEITKRIWATYHDTRFRFLGGNGRNHVDL